MNRENISELFPVLAYEPDKNLYFLDQGALGFGFYCSPLSGADDRVYDRLNNLLNLTWAPETILQFILWAGPDLKPERLIMDDTAGLPELLQESRLSRAKFISEGCRQPLDKSGLILREINLIITARIPLSFPEPTVKEQETILELRNASLETLKASGFTAQLLHVENYLRAMESIINWGDPPGWQLSETTTFDPNRLVRDQVADYNIMLRVHADRLELGGKVVKVLSPKRVPETTYFGVTRQLLMDQLTGSRGVKNNILLCTSIYFPDTENRRGKLEKERQWVANQAYGPMLKYTPRLARKKKSYDVLFESLENGDRLVRLAMTAVLICDPEDISGAVGNLQSYWRESGFQMLEDKYITLIQFRHSLPFGAEPSALTQLQRYRTMGARQALVFLPVFGSWKGTATPVMQFVGRDGQLMYFDLFDSPTNYNAVIAAQSGSGKSFLTNEIIMQYLSIGGRCWVLDIGRSYEKLAKLLDENFLIFDAGSDICLNPFGLIKDYNEEADILTGLITTMAAPTETLTDFQTSGLKRVLNHVWENEGPEMNVDSLATALKSEDDTRLRDIGEQLYPFTTKGEYGRYFNGHNNINFAGRLTVIELEQLRGRKQLQQVVLLMMIYQIQQDMYLGQRDRRKLVIIDEAWDILTQGNVATFIEHGFRRFRKYGGSAIVVTQSINDLYASDSGEAIAENSAIKMLLGQTREAISRLQQSRRLELGDYGYALLKTLHTVPGNYSELAIITEDGLGLARLYVEPFRKLLYSTKAEDVYALEQLQAQGLSLTDAINHLLAVQAEGPRQQPRLALGGGRS